jgi:membrane protein required for colicin V production
MEHINWMDVILSGILLVFSVMGFIAGFTEKFFSILSWVGAGISTLHLYPLAKPFAGRHIENDTWATIATFALIFLVLLIVFKLVTRFLSNSVKGGPLGSLDRGLGVILGALTGFFFLASLTLAGRYFFTPSHYPEPLKVSKIWSWAEFGGYYLEKVLPPLKLSNPLVNPFPDFGKSTSIARSLSVSRGKLVTQYSSQDRQRLDALAKQG